MQVVRFRKGSHTGLGLQTQEGRVVPLGFARMGELLRLPADALRDLLTGALRAPGPTLAPDALLAPVDGEMEVWCAGVTYRRSESARVEESRTPDIYTRVYRAERPELFFKATPRRVSGPGEPLSIREDSTWDVPEPELAVVANALGEVVGYTLGNDLSSRSIEGENPLYLPQAKVWTRSCALGPGVTPVWEVADPYNLTIGMRILRDGKVAWEGSASTSGLVRRIEDLLAYLFREDTFPEGVVLCTGTALVPDSPFTLRPGDRVEIRIAGLGTLANPIVQGKEGLCRALAGEGV